MLMRGIFSIIFLSVIIPLRAAYIMIPMDETQANHLKAYGIAYWILTKEVNVDWMLNYKGGSFMVKHLQAFENECVIRGVSYQVISDAEANDVLNLIGSPSSNMDVMKLEKFPKIAVYSPKSKQPWDDAVTLVLTYAEIPYDVIFDDEILGEKLPEYDWLHLHHEDFTGQYGKFYRSFHHFPWYQQQQREAEQSAKKHGFSKVSQLKLATVKTIKSYVASGGFLFAMCSATDTYDIALAAEGLDIIETIYDGDPANPRAQSLLDFDKTFAFENFVLERDEMVYEYSNIDNQPNSRGLVEQNDFFSLFQFSAKWDPIPTMLTQNHTQIVHGFMGQTTGFKSNLIKGDVIVMGETGSLNEAKYIHGVMGRGFWTFYGGHDPEDYQHFVNEPPTDLNL
ncbi:MAG: asparagine synthetase B, partial [Ekhidna sp.]